MKYDIQSIKEEAFRRAGVSSPIQKQASSNDESQEELIFKLRNFQKVANADDDLLLMYAGIIKEARQKALKKVGWENGLSLR